MIRGDFQLPHDVAKESSRIRSPLGSVRSRQSPGKKPCQKYQSEQEPKHQKNPGHGTAMLKGFAHRALGRVEPFDL